MSGPAASPGSDSTDIGPNEQLEKTPPDQTMRPIRISLTSGTGGMHTASNRGQRLLLVRPRVAKGKGVVATWQSASRNGRSVVGRARASLRQYLFHPVHDLGTPGPVQPTFRTNRGESSRGVHEVSYPVVGVGEALAVPILCHRHLTRGALQEYSSV